MHLIGYSSGSGLALLIAAQRNDVGSIRTVAGNIDHPAFTSFYRVTPMTQSLDPASVTRRINTIPQWHFFKVEDKVIPKLIGESYLRKAGTSSCLGMHVVPNVSHDKSWELLWPRLLQETSRAMIIKDCIRQLQ